MSGDRPCRGNGPHSGGNPSDQRDVYNYGGPEGGGPAANAGNGQRDVYQYGGERHGGGQADPASSADCNWRPDYSYSSPHAREWLQASRQQAGKPVDRDDTGMYTVQFGDSLSGIAVREMRDEGITGKIDQTQIKEEIDRIVKANDQNHPSLDCNTDLIKTGWKLEIPRWQPRVPAAPANPVEQPDRPDGPPAQSPSDDSGGVPHRRCIHGPRQGDNYYDQPDQPRVTINNYYIDQANFYGNGSGGWSISRGDMRPPMINGDFDNRSYDGYSYEQFPPRMMPPNGYHSVPPNGARSNGYHWEYRPCPYNTYSQDPYSGWIAQDIADRQALAYERSGGMDMAGSRRDYANYWTRRTANPGMPPQDWSSQDDSGANYDANDGYTVAYNPADGYSVRTLPYNPADGYSVRTLPYNPATDGYRIQPIADNRADNSTTNGGNGEGDNAYTYVASDPTNQNPTA